MPLNNSKFGDDGLRKILEIYPPEMKLEEINLANENIGDNEAKFLAEYLKENYTVKTVDISGNPIGYKGLQCLLEALRENITITSFVCEDIENKNEESKKTFESIQGCVDKNRIIEKNIKELIQISHIRGLILEGDDNIKVGSEIKLPDGESIKLSSSLLTSIILTIKPDQIKDDKKIKPLMKTLIELGNEGGKDSYKIIEEILKNPKEFSNKIIESRKKEVPESSKVDARKETMKTTTTQTAPPRNTCSIQ